MNFELLHNLYCKAKDIEKINKILDGGYIGTLGLDISYNGADICLSNSCRLDLYNCLKSIKNKYEKELNEYEITKN